MYLYPCIHIVHRFPGKSPVPKLAASPSVEFPAPQSSTEDSGRCTESNSGGHCGQWPDSVFRPLICFQHLEAPGKHEWISVGLCHLDPFLIYNLPRVNLLTQFESPVVELNPARISAGSRSRTVPGRSPGLDFCWTELYKPFVYSDWKHFGFVR